jgi:hypothetical protein
MAGTTARDELHRLLDQIPDSEIATAHRFLRTLVDPVMLSLLNAPFDDEPVTDSERAAVETARREAGTGTDHDEVLKEFGL